MFYLLMALLLHKSDWKHFNGSVMCVCAFVCVFVCVCHLETWQNIVLGEEELWGVCRSVECRYTADLSKTACACRYEKIPDTACDTANLTEQMELSGRSRLAKCFASTCSVVRELRNREQWCEKKQSSNLQGTISVDSHSHGASWIIGAT